MGLVFSFKFLDFSHIVVIGSSDCQFVSGVFGRFVVVLRYVSRIIYAPRPPPKNYEDLDQRGPPSETEASWSKVTGTYIGQLCFEGGRHFQKSSDLAGQAGLG